MECKGLIRFLFVIANLLLGLSVQANPLRTTYQAKIVKPDGRALESSNVSFRFSILDPSASCVLYVEDFAAINMTDSGGLISFSLGAGVRSFPTSGTAQTFANTFNNSITSFSCQTPGIYTPAAHDNRKIVMQFNDGLGWQTLPAMIINAVPFSMYAWKADDSTTLNGKADTAFVEYSTIPTCAASQALRYNGASFSCVSAGGGGGASYTVTSSDVTNALGFTPANSASMTTVTSTVSSLGGSVTTLTSQVSTNASSVTALTALVNSNSTSLTALTSLVNTHTNSLTALASQVSGITSSQWSTSGSAIYYNSGTVGIGTAIPDAQLEIKANTTATLQLSNANNNTNLASGSALGDITFAGQFNGSANDLARIRGIYTGNGTSRNGDLSFMTHNSGYSERMRITSTGNVGIATSAPIAKLHINGGSPAIYTEGSSSDLAYKTGDAWQLGDYNGTTFNERLRISSSGKVGINNSSPAQELDVTGTIAGSNFYANGSATPTYVFANDSNTGLSRPAANSIGLVNGGNESVRITSTGNVGIGNTAPTSLLTIGSTLGSSYALTANSSYQYGSIIQTLDASATNAAALWVRTNNGSTTNHLLRVQNNGLVGIGTTSPITTLDVSGGVRISMESAPCAVSYAGTLRYSGSNVEFCNGSAWTAFSTTNVTSSSVISALGYTPANSATVAVLTSSTTALTTSVNTLTTSVTGLAASMAAVTSSQWVTSGSTINYAGGNVGIGTAGPTAKLEVNGDLKVNQKVTAYTFISDQLSYGAVYANTSSSWDNPPQGDLNGIFMKLVNTSTTNGTGTFIYMNPKNQTQKAYIGAIATNTGSAAAIVIGRKTGASSYQESMRIDESGDVGIGTSTPGYPLSVSGVIQSSNGGFRFPDNSVQTTAAISSQWTSVTSGINYSGGAVAIGSTVLKVPLSVNYYSGIYDPSYQEIPTYAAAVLTASGPAEAGSGTTKPVLVLARQSSGTHPAVARLELGRYNITGGNANTMLNFKLSQMGIVNEGDNAPLVMSLQSSGYVGIGTASATSRLTVNGNVEITTGKLIFPDGTSQTTAAIRPVYLTYNNTVTVSAAGNSSGTMTTTSWVAPATGTVIMTYNKIMPYVFACAGGNFGISLRVNGAAGTLGNQAFITAINRYQNGEVAFPQITDMWAVTAGTTYTVTTEYFAQSFSTCTINTRGNSSGRDTIRIEYQ